MKEDQAIEKERDNKEWKKGIGMCYVHVSTPHKDYKHHVLRKCTQNRTGIKRLEGMKKGIKMCYVYAPTSHRDAIIMDCTVVHTSGLKLKNGPKSQAVK